MDHLESDAGKLESVNGMDDGTRDDDGWDEGDALG